MSRRPFGRVAHVTRHADLVLGVVAARYSFNSGARRYDSGQRSNFITLPAAVESLNQLVAWGPANICAYTTPLIERAAERYAADFVSYRKLFKAPAHGSKV